MAEGPGKPGAQRLLPLDHFPMAPIWAIAARLPSDISLMSLGALDARGQALPYSHFQIVSDDVPSSCAIWSWVKPMRARSAFKRSAVKSTFRPSLLFMEVDAIGVVLDAVLSGERLTFESLLNKVCIAFSCFFKAAILEGCPVVVFRRLVSYSRSSLRATRAISSFRESANVVMVASHVTCITYRSEVRL